MAVLVAGPLFVCLPVCRLHADGERLAAAPSAQCSAPGYGPSQAVDTNEATLWIANLEPAPANNQTWFQLDLGSVKPVARLRWLAAQGTPYPASAPSKYSVLVSSDALTWTAIPITPEPAKSTPVGNVLLNTNARYVRLQTTRVNDGTGWALGLREIWVTGGRDTTAEERQLRPRIAARDGAVALSWAGADVPAATRWDVFRAENPTAEARQPLVSLAGGVREYVDQIPNWTPRYYWLEAVNSEGKRLAKSERAAAVAHPPVAEASPVETFAFWYEAYKPSTDADASIKHIGNAAFVVGPGMAAAADLAHLGMGVLPYVTFYQTAGWAGSFPADADSRSVAEKLAPVAFYRPSLRFPGSPPGYAPSVFCRPDNVEYNGRAIQYTLCPNSSKLRDLVLALVRKQLEGGASGFFVDNGYADDVAARACCESSRHTHYYGDGLTSADAFLGLLLEVTCEVKRRHPGGVLMVNGGVPDEANFYGLTLGDVSDGQLWESYLRSSYSTPQQHAYEWEGVYRRSVAIERAWHATPPRRTFVLSYPWNREEAYFCYCTAKLCHLPWSASLGINDPEHRHFGGHFGTFPELVDLRLGAPVQEQECGGVKLGELYAREYERGVVLVNPTRTMQGGLLSLDRKRRWRDVFSSKEAEGTVIAAQLPAESGRVFLWR
jgi:hypothetical protein